MNQIWQGGIGGIRYLSMPDGRHVHRPGMLLASVGLNGEGWEAVVYCPMLKSRGAFPNSAEAEQWAIQCIKDDLASLSAAVSRQFGG